MRAPAAALAVLCGAALPGAAAAQSRDVPYYVQRPAERRQMLIWCRADAARADTRECRNARTANAVELMKPLPPDLLMPEWRMPELRPNPPPPPPQNIRRGAPRAT